MKNQKELKEKYMDIIRTEVWQDDSRMQEYSRKNSEYIVELANGNIISLQKPHIQKDFCFGMGMYATYTDEQFEAAEGMAEKARTDVQYFIDQNMKQITDKIELLKEALEGKRECYTFINYSGQPETSNLVTYKACKIYDNPEFSPLYWKNLHAIKKLSSSDIQLIRLRVDQSGQMLRLARLRVDQSGRCSGLPVSVPADPGRKKDHQTIDDPKNGLALFVLLFYI